MLRNRHTGILSKPITLFLPCITPRIGRVMVPHYCINNKYTTKFVLKYFYNKLAMHETSYLQLSSTLTKVPFFQASKVNVGKTAARNPNDGLLQNKNQQQQIQQQIITILILMIKEIPLIIVIIIIMQKYQQQLQQP
eukprot:UN03026